MPIIICKGVASLIREGYILREGVWGVNISLAKQIIKDNDTRPIPFVFNHDSNLNLGFAHRFYISKTSLGELALFVELVLNDEDFINALKEAVFYRFLHINYTSKVRCFDNFISENTLNNNERRGDYVTVDGFTALLSRFPELSLSHAPSENDRVMEVSLCIAGARRETVLLEGLYIDNVKGKSTGKINTYRQVILGAHALGNISWLEKAAFELGNLDKNRKLLTACTVYSKTSPKMNEVDCHHPPEDLNLTLDSMKQNIEHLKKYLLLNSPHNNESNSLSTTPITVYYNQQRPNHLQHKQVYRDHRYHQNNTCDIVCKQCHKHDVKHCKKYSLDNEHDRNSTSDEEDQPIIKKRKQKQFSEEQNKKEDIKTSSSIELFKLFQENQELMRKCQQDVNVKFHENQEQMLVALKKIADQNDATLTAIKNSVNEKISPEIKLEDNVGLPTQQEDQSQNNQEQPMTVTNYSAKNDTPLKRPSINDNDKGINHYVDLIHSFSPETALNKHLTKIE